MACKTPQQSTSSDTTYIHKVDYRYIDRLDSIYIYRDRNIETVGDTVYIRTDSIVYRYVFSSDTIRHTDTIYNHNTITNTVEVNVLTWWQKFTGVLGTIALGAILIVILRFILKNKLLCPHRNFAKRP